MSMITWLKSIKFNKTDFLKLLILPLIVSVVASIFTTRFEISIMRRQEGIGVVKSFLADLEQIKNTLPGNVVVTDCFNEKTTLDFAERYRYCIDQSKQKQDSAMSLLSRNQSSLEIFTEDQLVKSISLFQEKLNFDIYEMQNNQLFLLQWYEMGCKREVDIIPFDEMKIPKKNNSGYSCTLLVENYGNFQERMKSDDDNVVSPFQQGSMTLSQAQNMSMIIPGKTQKIEDYFDQVNNNLYLDLLYQIEEITKELKNYVK